MGRRRRNSAAPPIMRPSRALLTRQGPPHTPVRLTGAEMGVGVVWQTSAPVGSRLCRPSLQDLFIRPGSACRDGSVGPAGP